MRIHCRDISNLIANDFGDGQEKVRGVIMWSL